MSNKIKIYQENCQSIHIVVIFIYNQVILVVCHRYQKGKLGTCGANKTQEF